jgi:hypothetical protein
MRAAGFTSVTVAEEPPLEVAQFEVAMRLASFSRHYRNGLAEEAARDPLANRRHAMQAPRVSKRMDGGGRAESARAPACRALPSDLLGLPARERWEGNHAASCCNK